MRAETVTLDDLKEWPPLVSVAEAGRALGVCCSTAYSHLRTGLFPVPVVKVGGRAKIRTADLMRFLSGNDDTESAA